MLVEPSYLFSAAVPEAKEPGQGDPCLPLRCHVVIHGLHAGQPVSWEVTASLEALLQPRDGVGSEEPPRRAAAAGEKPLHGLAARSVIRDSEKAAQREAELEQGERCSLSWSPLPSLLADTSLCAGFARRFRLKAMQTSKACNVPSLYTCVVPVDGATRVVLPAAPQVWSTGRARGTGWGWGTEHGTCRAGIGALQPHAAQAWRGAGVAGNGIRRSGRLSLVQVWTQPLPSHPKPSGTLMTLGTAGCPPKCRCPAQLGGNETAGRIDLCSMLGVGSAAMCHGDQAMQVPRPR